MVRRRAWLLVLLTSFAVVRLAAQTSRPLALPDLLARAGAYVSRFEIAFSNVVSEERYSQSVIPGGQTFVGGPRAMHRELVSDLLLVKLPGRTDWLPFRDVFEVDGEPIRDRADRLVKLFVASGATSTERAAEITEQSARYNVGTVRTVNHPLLALQVLRPSQQYRFKFSNPKADASVGAGVVAIEFNEDVRPAIIHGQGGRDMLMHGRVWIDSANGTLLRSEVRVDSAGVSATLTTRFRYDMAFDVAIPAEMQEEYIERDGARSIGSAKYGQFRQFKVHVNTDFR